MYYQILLRQLVIIVMRILALLLFKLKFELDIIRIRYIVIYNEDLSYMSC
jgi:hypothetical protein